MQIFKIILICLFSSPPVQAMVEESFNQQFIESFIKHYEFSPEGRYTHEYHPFLLAKTSESLLALEDRLKNEGLSLAGRMVIFGYEENAVPSYYTNFKKPRINDEAILKNTSGWTLKLHNRFGIMTGFLFKDFNELGQTLYQPAEPIFQHINPENILVFDDRAAIFQEHAFGEVLTLLYQAHDAVTNHYTKKNVRGVLEDMIKLWQIIYSNAFKVGNKEVAGTQDILFSIEYLNYLLRSSLPFLKFFTGPDITYPIEISCKQETGATANAQSFVKVLTKKLQPVNNKTTVYVFCSFVDGVGKSTMLGNIKNWMKYGDNYERFEHVDNTSSQLIELFKFKDNVYIADLPAQMSHFTYKPDGFVFVDARTECCPQVLNEVAAFVEAKRDVLLDDYKNKCGHVSAVIKQQGFLAAELNEVSQPVNWFLKNVFLLGKGEENYWIPFEYQEKHYLFNREQPWELRVLCPLNKVKSEGLKNISSEQMFFNKGIRLPLRYESFLTYFVDSIKKEQIQEVVFVDFLSMYPRSSRENIRINYLLQQMALLNPLFAVKQSLYCDFISGGQLLYSLFKKNIRSKIVEAFEQEVLIRLALYHLIFDGQRGELGDVGLSELNQKLKDMINNIPAQDKKNLSSLVNKKIATEKNVLERTYGLSKSFINVQLFMVDAACAFLGVLQDFLENHVVNKTLNELWDDPGALTVNSFCKQGVLQDVSLFTTQGKVVDACYAVGRDCKDDLLLAPAMRLLRANWYAALSNLLYAKKQDKNVYTLEKVSFKVFPFFLKKGSNDLFYIVRPEVELWEKDKKLPPMNKHFFLQLQLNLAQARYARVDDNAYLYDWKVKNTNKGMYAFDCDLDKLKDEWQLKSATSLWVRRYQTDKGNLVMPAFELYEKLHDSVYWKSEANQMVQQALRSPTNTGKPAGLIYGNRNIICGLNTQRSAAKKLIRLLVTLDMVMKDPEAHVVVRYGNRDDFKAAIKLFEKITLPRYYGVLFPENLFKNYDEVEPYPSWEFWDRFSE